MKIARINFLCFCLLVAMTACISLFQTTAAAGQEKGDTQQVDLEYCLKTARANNPRLNAMRYRALSAKDAVSEARAKFFPSIDAFSTYDRNYLEDVGEYDSYSSGFTLTQPIFRGGKLWQNYQEAKREWEATREEYITTLIDVIRDVSVNYFKTLEQKHLIKVNEDNLKSAGYHLDLTRARFSVGLTNRADVLKAEVEKAQAEVNLIKVRNEYLQAMARLNKSMGVAVVRKFELVDTYDNLLDPSKLNLLQALDEAAKNRPEMKRIRARIEKQKAAIKLAQGDFWPQVNARGSYGWKGEKFNEQKHNWDVGVTLDMSLFSGLGTVASVSGARRILLELEHQKLDISDQIELEVYSALLNLKASYAEINATRKLVLSAEENLRVIEGLYREGLSNFIDVVDAQSSLTGAKTQYIQAIYNHHVNETEYARAVGNEIDSNDMAAGY